MKRIFINILFLAAVSRFIGCAPKGEDPEQMIAAAKELDKQFVAAISKGMSMRSWQLIGTAPNWYRIRQTPWKLKDGRP